MLVDTTSQVLEFIFSYKIEGCMESVMKILSKEQLNTLLSYVKETFK